MTSMVIDTNAAERKRLAEERLYRKGSHGRRHQALMAYATAGNMAPVEAYRKEVEKIAQGFGAPNPYQEIDMNDISLNADIIDMLKGIQARLDRIEGLLQTTPAAAVQASGQFAAVALSATIDKGKTYWKVQGGNFMQYGIMIWPEVLAQTDFADADPLKAHDLTGYTAVYSENEDGQKKIISLSRNAALNGNGHSNGSTSAGSVTGAALLDSRPKPAPTQKVGTTADHWRMECETAEDALMFDTAMAKLEPDFYRNSDNVRAFRESLFGEMWRSAEARAMTAGLVEYAVWRKKVHGKASHNAAKPKALEAFEKALNE